MNRSSSWVLVSIALGGVAAFGCSSDPSKPVTTTATTTAVPTVEELSDSVNALRANDTEATFDALDRCMGGRGRGHGGDHDAGVDEDKDDRGNGRGPRDNNRPQGRPGIERGLDLLLAFADLDALKACQEIAVSCLTSDNREACREEVEDCVRPILEDAFKALCDEQSTQCANKDDDTCKHAARACNAVLNAANAGASKDDTATDTDDNTDRKTDRRGRR